jgi:hydrogenase maturation protease
VVVGGVGQLWQGDLDLGRRAVEELAGEDLGPHVAVEDLCYGAVHVSWRLDDLAPQALIVVGAQQRGRAPGSVERRIVEAFQVPPGQARHAVDEALTGYLSIDLLVEVLAALDALPPETVVIEVEPQTRYPSHDLSPVCAEALGEALTLVRAEVRRLTAPPP